MSRCPPSAPLRWLASVAAFASAAPAQETPTPEPAPVPAPAATPGFEELFAQDALFFLGIDGLAALRSDFAASAWGRMFADEKAEPVRAAFRGLLEALAADSKRELGTDLVEAIDMIRGRFGVTLAGEPDLEASSTAMGDVHGVLAADAGERAVELRERLVPLFDRMVERGEAVMKSESAGDVEFLTVTPTGEGDRGRISLAAAGSTVALGMALGSHVERDDFARFLGGLGGDGKDTLSQSPAFRTSLAALPGGIKLWLDTGALIRAGMAGAPEEDPDAAMERALGLDQFGALTARFALDAVEMRVEAHQAWGGGWLPRLIDAWLAGGDTSLLKLFPSDVIVALSLHLDLVAGVDASRAATKELGGPPIFGDPDAPADPATAADESAFDARRDLLDHLDGRVAFFVAGVDPSETLPMPTGGVPMNFAVVLGLKNAAALRTSVDKVLRSQGLHAARRRTEFEGFEVYSIPMMPLLLNYAIVDDFAVFSLSPTLLQDVLRRKSHAELASLATEKVFKRQLDAMNHSHALLLWAKNSSAVLSSAAGGAAEGAGLDGAGDGEGDGTEESAPKDSVEGRVAAFLAALEKLDPTLMTTHLPGGSLLGLAVDQAGIRLEGVSR